MLRRFALFAAVAAVCLVGCESAEYHSVPVKGRVTLDGKPLANASVTFQPRATGGSAAAGPGSYGKTNEDGHYELRIATDDNPGAVTGKHVVTISVTQPGMGDALISSADEIIPAEYRNGKKEYVVPADGTETADFALKSP